MNGAIAAGHPLTAEAGVRILAEGGNAVDACVAAAFVAWVAESPLTGPGAGGFMLVHRGRDGANRLLDFFVAIPGSGLTDEVEEMERVDVRFDAQTTQPFLVGPSSCAVPGVPLGLAEAHRLYGRLPWRELLSPATELARAGVRMNASQANLHEILDPILRREPEGRAVYGEAAPLAEGHLLRMPELADTLELLAHHGVDVLYRGELAEETTRYIRRRNGRLTRADLAAYRVIRRQPISCGFRACEFVTNPPPSSGGILIAFALCLLDALDEPASAHSAEAVAILAEVMREVSRARGPRFVSELYRGGAAKRLLSSASVAESVARIRASDTAVRAEPRGLPSTTHVSVVDAVGNAASLSTSTGSGSGVVVPGTGIHLNNMLGEIDLNPAGTRRSPGRRLTSMMAPSLVLDHAQPKLVVGSAGSERLRGAILQVVLNTIDYKMDVDKAIDAPRVHEDGRYLHLEGGIHPTVARRLEEQGYNVWRWQDRNLFFGGVAAVGASAEGSFQAAGDPRRGGIGLVVGPG